jgi:hypothetical protein
MAENDFAPSAAQTELPLLTKLSLEEIGQVASFKHVFVHQEFIQRYVGWNSLNQPETIEEASTGVICPFCDRGEIIVGSVVPRLEPNHNTFGESLRHVGDDYYLQCSNEGDCGATYQGTLVWLHLD